METETHNLSEKVSLIFRLLDAGYLLRNEDMNDHSKRVALRIIFIQVDNLLKFVGRLKNGLFREGAIDISTKIEIEGFVRELENSYRHSFDIVRDKLSAHNQPLDILALLDWWNEIDYTTIEILYDDAKAIQRAFKSVRGITFLPISDYSPLTIPSKGALSKNQDSPKVSSDRLAISKSNTIAMIACHDSQEKAQLIVSVIDFLEIDFALTVISNNPSTIYERLVFDIGWMLAIIDLCSLIDNLFETNQYDQSLLEHWKHDMKGYDYLNEINGKRNHELESIIREVRNKFAAHVDSDDVIKKLYDNFNTIDLASVHSYACMLVNTFLNACRMDIRTKMFLIQSAPVSGVIAVNKTVEPFGN